MTETQLGVNGIDPEKFERQCALELEGFSLGIDRYLTNVTKIHNDPNKDNTVLTPEQRVMQEAIVGTSLNLKEKIQLPERGGGVYSKFVKEFFKGFDTDRLAFLTLRYCLNIQPTHAQLTGVCVRLGEHIEKDYEYMQFQKIAPAYLSKVEYNLRTFHLNHRHRVLNHASKKVEIRNSEGETVSQGIPKLNWISEQRFSIGKFLIEALTETQPKLFKLTHAIKRKNVSGAAYGVLSVEQLRIERTDLCTNTVERLHSELVEMSPLVYPFIIKPKPWTSIYGGGFWTQYKSLHTSLIRARNKNALKVARKHGVENILKAINIVQDTQYRINKRILEVMQEGKNSGLGGLPVFTNQRVEVNGRYPLEEESPWDNDEFNTLKKVADPELFRWIAEKAQAYDLWNRNVSKRQALLWKLKIANKFKNESELYLAWNLDYRGRMYCFQPFVNPQVDDSGKALLEFAQGKPLGEHGLKHLMIHGANEFGYDKATLDERIQWVKQHGTEILDSAENPLDGMRFWCDAEYPYCFLAFCFEYAECKRDPVNFLSHLSVYQDGTCSGLQHYSALLKDSVGGKVVNLTPAVMKADVYTEVANIVNRTLKEDFNKGGAIGKYARAWLKVGVDRKICKRNVMTFCYGATRSGFTQQLIDYILKKGIRLQDTDEFAACHYLGGINWLAIEETLVKSVEAMKFLQKLAFMLAKNGLDVKWVSPIGLRVSQDYLKTKTKQLNTYWGQTRIQPSFSEDKKEKNAVGSRNGIAPNYIHSLDASHLMLTALKCADQGITAFSFVHDSFGTHAADMETMSRVLRETFIEMYSENLLDKFVEDIRQQIPDTLVEEFEQIVQDYKPEMGSLDVNSVQESPYFFS